LNFRGDDHARVPVLLRGGRGRILCHYRQLGLSGDCSAPGLGCGEIERRSGKSRGSRPWFVTGSRYDFDMLRIALQYPLLIGVTCFFALWAAARMGDRIGSHRLSPKELEEYKLVLGATLTLLGLIVGFAFSMAVGRYDQRKNYEEEEANAIGTEY